jgi:hypothetical protein
MTTHIIGCGGVASYFLPPFLRTLRYCQDDDIRSHRVILHDGDRLEEHNLRRQNFDREHIDAYKATALAAQFPWYGRLKTSTFYIDSAFRVKDGDSIIIMADNHLARLHALDAADAAARVTVLSAANSTIGAESWWYSPSDKGTPRDPRVRWPEMLTDDSGSPVHASGCNSEARLREVPQTPIANHMASAHLLLLWNFVFIEKPKLDPQITRPFWPLGFSNTATSTETTRYADAA